jgi:hypothetical protein
MQNMTAKPIKVSSYRNEATYTYNGRYITTERKTDRKYACGLVRSTSYTSTRVDGKMISGGLKDAVRMIDGGKI